jgi:Ca2+-binding RTX toxin-like protein
MTIDLSTLTFTHDTDILPLLGIKKIVNSSHAYTLGGNDILTGTAIDNRDTAGFENRGTIDTGTGNDKITGTGSLSVGVNNKLGSTIDTGTGDDTITGTTSTKVANFGVGILNSGKIAMGAGHDRIAASGATGIENQGSIDTGTGNDTITSSGSRYGILNSGKIDTGAGQDTISATATNAVRGINNNANAMIDTGAGNDTIVGKANTYGIFNLGKIDTGTGNDTITGTSISKVGCGIYNNGTIDTGNGRDIVDALKSGFQGNGYINLGHGNDTIKGFGTGHFDGGTGRDTLIFGAGTYTVAAKKNLDGFYTISNGITEMQVKNFESIGGNTDSTHLISFSTLISQGKFVIA